MNSKDEKEKINSGKEKKADKDPSLNKKYIIAIVAAIVVIAAVVLIAVLSKGSSPDGGKDGDTSSVSDTATEDTVQPLPSYVKLVPDEDTYPLDLGFVSLRYPKEYEEKVTITGVEEHDIKDAFTLSFAADDKKLFDLSFNKQEKDSNVLGTLILDEGNVAVYVKTYVIDTDDIEHLAEQESLNVIIEAMISDYGFVTGEIIENEDKTLFPIETETATLYYPNKWKDKVDVKVDGKTVSFVSDKTPLFDLRFEECDGYLLGTYDGTPIYIVEYDVDTEEQIAMQQDVNVIIENLSKDEKFKINA